MISLQDFHSRRAKERKILHVLGDAVDVRRCVTQGTDVIVVQQALTPHGPGLGVVQFGDGAVQQRDGGAVGVVVSNPLHCGPESSNKTGI